MLAKQYDVNVKIETHIKKDDVRFFDIDGEPFRIYGVFREGDRYRRLPDAVAKTISPGIHEMCGTCAGGRVRFLTDSPYVAIKVEYGNYELGVVSNPIAMNGFDMYADGDYVGAFRPAADFSGGELESVIDITGEHRMRLITVNMPLYTEVKRMYIGVADGSRIECAPDYANEKPIVFYGSSITNGAGASRPGTTYVARVSRMLDTNFVCLGFGGLAKAEVEFAEYIAGLDMSVFVYDYDHNAKTVEYLAETHERMYKIVRKKNPNLPILLISRPNVCPSAEERFAIIKRTYDNAVAAGDKNIYILKGVDFFGENALDFTVDGTHPSDLGYYFMAQGIAPVLKKLI